jgi:hypothetical protein
MATIETRVGRLKARNVKPGTLALDKVLFEPQYRFASDPARFKTALCSRRAGKTVACAAALLDAALQRPGVVVLYISISRLNSKRLIWRTLLDLNRDYRLGGAPVESELYLRFGNGSIIYLAGISDKNEIQKFRGLPLALCICDESQTLPGYLGELVDAVIVPALMDYNGSLALVGTPPPAAAGYFIDCARSATWSHHAWTAFDNPWILKKSGKTPRKHLEEEMLRRGVLESDPIIQREWYGRIALDESALVFKYDSTRNHFDELPATRRPWEYVIGCDLGWDDFDAVSVLAWSEDSPNVYLVEESVLNKQTVTQIGNQLVALNEKYRPRACVVDTGGLGRKIAEEFRARWGMSLEAADKTRKNEHVELLNDALRSGRFFARRDGRFASDTRLVTWDKSNPEKWVFNKTGYHSDILDSALYGFRKCLAWLHEPEPAPPPSIGSNDWLRRQEEDMLEASEGKLQRVVEERNERNAMFGDFGGGWE